MNKHATARIPALLNPLVRSATVIIPATSNTNTDATIANSMGTQSMKSTKKRTKRSTRRYQPRQSHNAPVFTTSAEKLYGLHLVVLWDEGVSRFDTGTFEKRHAYISKLWTC